MADYYDNPGKGESMSEGGGDKEMPHTPGKTYLIDKNVCEGMKAGDEMVLKITRVLDKEYEVTYPEGEHKEEGEEHEGMEHEESDMKNPNPSSNDMSSMMY